MPLCAIFGEVCYIVRVANSLYAHTFESRDTVVAGYEYHHCQYCRSVIVSVSWWMILLLGSILEQHNKVAIS